MNHKQELKRACNKDIYLTISELCKDTGVRKQEIYAIEGITIVRSSEWHDVPVKFLDVVLICDYFGISVADFVLRVKGVEHRENIQ